MFLLFIEYGIVNCDKMDQKLFHYSLFLSFLMVDQRQISHVFPEDDCKILFHTMNGPSLKFYTIIELTFIRMKS